MQLVMFTYVRVALVFTLSFPELQTLEKVHERFVVVDDGVNRIR